jgi:hypothetical protein
MTIESQPQTDGSATDAVVEATDGEQAGRAEAPLVTRRRWRPRRTQTRRAGPETVTFADVVRAHRAWETAAATDSGAAGRRRAEFEELTRMFERRFGEVRDAYWSIRDASGVAITVATKRSRWTQAEEEVPHFHRATDWATRDEPAVAQALDECETLAVKSEEVLRGASEKIALRRIFAVASQLLGIVDRTYGRQAPSGEPLPKQERLPDKKEQAVVDGHRKELVRIERFYLRAGNKQARIVFFWGMVLGLFALLPVTAAAVTLIWTVGGLDGSEPAWRDLQLFIVSIAAGALGALLSVLTRMASLTGTFNLDHEVGRKQVRYLGFYRPFLGAIFGVATFLLLASGVLDTTSTRDQELAYYGALAFLAGFFERLMKIAPGGVPTEIETKTKEDKETAADQA